MEVSKTDIEFLKKIDREGVKISLPLQNNLKSHLIKGNILSELKIIPYLPAIIKGKWYHLYIFISTPLPLIVIDIIKRKFPYTTEFFINQSIPYGKAHNLTVELYGNLNFDALKKAIEEIEGIDTFEIEIFEETINKKDLSFKKIDKSILERIDAFKTIEYGIFKDIVEEFGEEEFILSLTSLFETDVQKNSSLKKPFKLFHDIYWYNIKNFMHIHYVIEEKAINIIPRKELEKDNFLLIPEKAFKNYFHIEKDLYSLKELHLSTKKMYNLLQQNHHLLKGILFYHSHLINERIFKDFMKNHLKINP